MCVWGGEGGLTCSLSASSMRSRPSCPLLSTRHMRSLLVVKVGTISTPGALRALPRSRAREQSSKERSSRSVLSSGRLLRLLTGGS